MGSAPARTAVTSLLEWATVVRADGIGTQLELVGELVGEPHEGRRAQLLLPTGDGVAGFAPLAVMVDNVRSSGSAGGRTTGRSDAHSRARGCRTTVEGRVEVDRRGSLIVRGGRLTVDPTSPGPYSVWRQAQAAAAGVSASVDVVRHGVGGVITHLRSAPRDKKILWLGRDGTEAYRDAHRGRTNLIEAMEVAGAAMSGPRAVEEMCRALATVDADRIGLVVISRGGGDIGDLAVFDDARVLASVRSCPVPTVCAVGHFKDQPLVEAVCDWALATPSDVYKVLSAGLAAGPTAREERARQAEGARVERACQVERARADRARQSALGAELARARADLATAQGERDRARFDEDWLRRNWIAMVREENARRITQRYRLTAGWIAATTPVMGALWTWAVPPAWHVTALDHLALIVAGWALAVAIRTAPRRLGRRPWWRLCRTADLAAAIRVTTTVGGFNRAAAAHDGHVPRLRRRRS